MAVFLHVGKANKQMSLVRFKFQLYFGSSKLRIFGLTFIVVLCGCYTVDTGLLSWIVGGVLLPGLLFELWLVVYQTWLSSNERWPFCIEILVLNLLPRLFTIWSIGSLAWGTPFWNNDLLVLVIFSWTHLLLDTIFHVAKDFLFFWRHVSAIRSPKSCSGDIRVGKCASVCKKTPLLMTYASRLH